MGGWREGWINRRNRWLGDARFQAWASRFSLTRPIARRRARSLFDLVAGFVYSQILAACVRLDLFALLVERPLRAEEVAQRLDLPLESAQRLLRGAAALDLLEKLPGERFTLGIHGAALLGSPGVTDMILHHDLLYGDLADPVALLKRGGGGGALSGFWPYAQGAEAGEAAAAYSRLMARSLPAVAAQVLNAYPLGRHRHLMDVGGGEGAFLAEVAHRHPRLRLTLFDLPEVAERARHRLPARVAVVPGRFGEDPLPEGTDVISLVRILHDHDDAVAERLLRDAAGALPPGGVLLIAEPMAGSKGAETIGDPYFGFYLYAMGSGRPRTPDEIGAMLKRSGFTSWRLLRTAMPLSSSVIAAAK